MPRFAMVATEAFDRGGLSASRGDILENVTPIQVAMLKYQGVAREATPADYVTRAVEPEPPQPDPPAPEPDPDPLPPPAAVRTRRTYRRRDLTGER